MGVHKKPYNLELLYQIYRTCDGHYLTMERYIRENKVNLVPKSVETIKPLVRENDFLGRLEKETAEETKDLIAQYKAKKPELMKLLWRVIHKYEATLDDKKYISEQGLKEVWNMLRAEMELPSVITKNENENSETISFLEDITDEGSESTEAPTETPVQTS